MKPEISVIVPVYNAEKYLERCVGSLTGQTEKNIEIILIDDGSTDDSGAMCDRFAEEDERIRVIHKENAGQGFARNDGLAVMSGEYVSFLDADDYYEKDACEVFLHTMRDTKADIVSYGYRIDDKDGALVREPRIRERSYEKTAEKDEIRNGFLLHLFGDSMKDDDLRAVSSCMSVFRAELIREHEIRFPSEREVDSEDNAFSLAYCRFVKKAAAIPRVLYHYCQNEVSFTQGYREDRFRLLIAHDEMLRGYSGLYGFRDGDPLYEEVSGRIAHTDWVSLMACLRQEYRHSEKSVFLRKAKKMCAHETVVRALAELPYRELPLKQRIFYHAIVNGWYGLVYLMTGIRAESKL